MKKNAVLPCKFDPGLDVGFPYCIQSSLNAIQAWFFYVAFMFTTAYWVDIACTVIICMSL